MVDTSQPNHNTPTGPTNPPSLQPVIDFSDDFPAGDFERLRAQIDPTTGRVVDEPKAPASDKQDDIGHIWRDLRNLSHLERLRDHALTAYTKSLPVWRRGVFMVKSALSGDRNDQPPTAVSSPTADSSATPTTAAMTLPDSLPSKHTTIEIKLSMPNAPKLKLPPLPSSRDDFRSYFEQLRTYFEQLWLRIPRRFWIIGGSAIVSVLVVVFVVHLVIAGVSKDPAIGDATNAKTRDGLQRGTPAFNTLLPIGKDINALGGWARVSPPDREAVWAYADKINGVSITVSEQPLPKAFAVDTEQKIADLANGYKATEKINAGNTTLYLGRSVNGAESVILTKQKLLILIKSVTPISSDQWVSYIESLQLQ